MIVELTFPNDHTPLDRLLFLTFKREVEGLIADTLRRNPELAAMGEFPPRGTVILVERPAPAAAAPRKLIRLFS